jgi:hypothetical protein
MKLPDSVQEIADVIGDERALFLIGQLPRCYVPGRSGTSGSVTREAGKSVAVERVIMYVPKRLTFDHQLVTILGWQDAQKLVTAFGGEILYPANCTAIYRPFRDEHIVRLVSEGVPTVTVAEWFNVSERQVRNLTRDVREKPQEDRRAANDNNHGLPTITPKRRANDKLQQATAA